MIKNIIWDFDGVILDSVSIKTDAFAHIFRSFPKDKVNTLLEYHIINGGISRFEKIDYFFSTILHQSLSSDEMEHYASEFADFSLAKLRESSYLISSTLRFIKQYHNHYDMSIASGAFSKDLLFLCDKHSLTPYFHAIYGSPPRKEVLIERILKENPAYKLSETCLIGDTINDYDAAKKNGILYYGFNNEDMRSKSDLYLDDYKPLEIS